MRFLDNESLVHLVHVELSNQCPFVTKALNDLLDLCIHLGIANRINAVSISVLTLSVFV